MAGSQQDTTGCVSYPDNVAGSGSAQNAIMADDELLDAIASADLGNQLCDLGVPVASITADDQCGSFDTFGNGEEDAGNKGLGVVLLLEDLDLLAQAGAGAEPLVSHGPLSNA